MKKEEEKRSLRGIVPGGFFHSDGMLMWNVRTHVFDSYSSRMRAKGPRILPLQSVIERVSENGDR